MGDHHRLLQHAEGRGGDDGHQRQRRVLQHDVHRVRIDDLHLLDVRDVLPGLVLDVELPGEGEADILGGHRLAGGELHVGAQLQPHRLAVRLVGPLGGQRRLEGDQVAGDTSHVIGGMGRQRVGILETRTGSSGGIADIQRDDQCPAPLGTLRCGRAGAGEHVPSAPAPPAINGLRPILCWLISVSPVTMTIAAIIRIYGFIASRRAG